MSEATEDSAAQAAADVAAATEAAAAARQGADATDDLDSVLASIKEYREETASRETTASQPDTGDTGQREHRPSQQGGSEGQTTEKRERADAPDQRRIAALEDRIVRDDVSRTIDSMRTSQPALKALDAGVLEAYLDAQARRDPRIRGAWMRRDSDPETFKKVVGGLARRMASGLPVPSDGKADGERAAAVTASRGATQHSAIDEDDKRVLAMSDAEFEQDWQKSVRSARR